MHLKDQIQLACNGDPEQEHLIGLRYYYGDEVI